MAKVITALNSPNNTANFYPADQFRVSKKFLLKASNGAIPAGALMATEVTGSNPTGYIIKAPTTNANGQNVVGILEEPITTADDGYATDRMVSVLVPTSPASEMNFLVGSGTFTASDVGRICQIHTDSLSVAVDTNGLGVEITGYRDATHGTAKILAAKVVTS